MYLLKYITSPNLIIFGYSLTRLESLVTIFLHQEQKFCALESLITIFLHQEQRLCCVYYAWEAFVFISSKRALASKYFSFQSSSAEFI